MPNFNLLIILKLLILILASGGENVYQRSNLSTFPTCIFLGCSCIKDKIRCPADNSVDSFLTMFPKRQIGKTYMNNVTIEINDNLLEMIPDDRFAGLDVYKIDLSNNQIYKLSPETFRDIVRLEILDLSSNSLRFLNANTFYPIETSLLTLNLNNNYLSEMETARLTNVFSKLTKLENLDLSVNRLIYVPNLIDLNIVKLNLGSNMLETLVDADTFDNLLPASLVDLQLQNNRLKQITENSFENLKNLKYLNLESNEISAIAENSFNNLRNLQVLNLKKNNFKHIPSRIFLSLDNLEYLDLSSQNQDLKQINDYAFDRQFNRRPIKKIILTNNSIARIDNRAFCSKHNKTPYVNIKEIDLSFNLLTTINSCILRQLAKGFNEIQSTSNKQKYYSRALVRVNNPNADHANSNRHSNIITCNCEITKSNKLIDLDGVCKRSDNSNIFLKQYDSVDCSINNLNQIHKLCSSKEEYECPLSNDIKYLIEETTRSNKNENSRSNTTLQIATTLPFNSNNSSLNDFNLTFIDPDHDHYSNKSIDDTDNLNENRNLTISNSLTSNFNSSKHCFYLFLLFIFEYLFCFIYYYH